MQIVTLSMNDRWMASLFQLMLKNDFPKRFVFPSSRQKNDLSAHVLKLAIIRFCESHRFDMPPEILGKEGLKKSLLIAVRELKCVLKAYIL